MQQNVNGWTSAFISCSGRRLWRFRVWIVFLFVFFPTYHPRKKKLFLGAIAAPKLLQELKDLVIVCYSAYNVEKRKLNYVFEFCLHVMFRCKESFVTTWTKASASGPGLLLLHQYVEGKYHNGAYFHSQHANIKSSVPSPTLPESIKWKCFIKDNSDGK